MCQLCYFSFSFQKCFYLLVYCLFYSERYNFQVLFCFIFFLFFIYISYTGVSLLSVQKLLYFSYDPKKELVYALHQGLFPIICVFSSKYCFFDSIPHFLYIYFLYFRKKSQSLLFDLGSSLPHLKCSYPLFYWFNLLARLLFISSLKLVFFTIFLSFYLIQFTNP